MEKFAEDKKEKAILIGLNTRDGNADSDEISMDELEALLETAGGECVAQVLQSRGSPEPRTFIGSGKALEIKELVSTLDADMAVFDNEITASQTRALEELLGIRVIDRSSLILDIFAQRARTKEGRLQVELAQYKYLLPRLTGMWKHLVRQTASGGKSPIGTRGPGETQLETDRRHIRRKLLKLEEELREVRKNRATVRERRIKNEVPVIAIVGYTNAGKSTLLNNLTNENISSNDRLFDTLDTTTRKLKISDTTTALLSDTVGFINKLPHHLIEAFKATLEELVYADVLLHVINAASPDWRRQAEVVNALIHELGADQRPIIEVYNKMDVAGETYIPHGKNKVAISAKTGEGLDKLLEAVSEILDAASKTVKLLLPYNRSELLDQLYKKAKVNKVEYVQEGIEVEAVCTPAVYGQMKEYVVYG